ncbi:MAG: hypothetical protein WDM90_18635 [Ferruginibacter sp.]
MADSIQKSKLTRGKKIKFIFFTMLFLLTIIFVFAEIILGITKYESTYDKMQRISFTHAKWWACDSVDGPRYIANQVTPEDSMFFSKEEWYYKRLQMVNNAGYHDTDNFTDISPNSDSLRVLVDGDSFTWGASSDVGSSYVDVFEKDLKKAYPSIVWNTGIPATGTNHAIFTTKKFLPLQKSNYVVLGFYVGNDFGDNLVPFDKLIFNKLASCYNLYDYDKNFKPYQITEHEAYKKATGSYPMEELNFFQKILIRSRVVTFLSDLKDKVVNRISGNKAKANEQEYKMTKEYLKQLNDYVKENNAELIVLVIPSRDDVIKKEIYYLNTIKILDELSVKYVDPLSQFKEDDYLKINGGHWKNRAHILVGHALSKYLLDYIEKKQQKSFRKN